MDNLRRIDLNLLVTLEALLTERSVVVGVSVDRVVRAIAFHDAGDLALLGP